MALVDFHNHLIPGVDDGAADVEQSRRALERMCRDGVEVVVATPHFDGSLTRDPVRLAERLEALDAGWEALARLAAEEFPGVELKRGAEVKLDLPDPDLSDARLRLGGGVAVLLEFPFMTVPPMSALALGRVRQGGWLPVVAHPERYAGLDASLELVLDWRRAGAVIQVNGPSLLGRYGREAQERARRLVARGLVDCVASDYHSRGEPLVAEYRESLVELGDADRAELLLEVNPRRILAGQAPLPVSPLRETQRLWSRLTAIFR
jgi:protein-tyrosine phosphatase